MNIFKDYSYYYDLLYKEKNYQKEAEYINKLIKKYRPEARKILNLGCGTGKHDRFLAEMGYELHSVDLSKEMLNIAKNCKNPDNLFFYHGDIRNIRIEKRFDAVISLFHVISYQITNQDLKDTFNTVYTHLKDDGIFIFDCWYGPAILTDRPSVRLKRIENENVRIVRIAEPIIYPNENIVDVNYNLVIYDKKEKKIRELNETHRMRYIFKSEIDFLLEVKNLELLHYREWMSEKKPGFDTWSVYWIAQKNQTFH